MSRKYISIAINSLSSFLPAYINILLTSCITFSGTVLLEKYICNTASIFEKVIELSAYFGINAERSLIIMSVRHMEHPVLLSISFLIYEKGTFLSRDFITDDNKSVSYRRAITVSVPKNASSDILFSDSGSFTVFIGHPLNALLLTETRPSLMQSSFTALFSKALEPIDFTCGGIMIDLRLSHDTKHCFSTLLPIISSPVPKSTFLRFLQ